MVLKKYAKSLETSNGHYYNLAHPNNLKYYPRKCWRAHFVVPE
jgi:hypothetical protein